MMLTDLATVLRSAGIRVIEEPGWKTRTNHDARGNRLEMAEVCGVTCHHTGNNGARGVEPSRRVVRDGRADLTGPLAHLLLRTDGVVRVIAAGHCNHAGVSRYRTLGNAYRIGIEAEASGVPGTKADWPEIQMGAYARTCRALADHYGFSIGNVLGHKETCSPAGRKTDPDFDMDAFRSAVRSAGTTRKAT